MEFVTWWLVLLVLAFLIYYVLDLYTFWWRRGIPCAKGLRPFVGHMLPMLMAQTNMATLCNKIYKSHKNQSLVGLFSFGKPTLLIREPAIVKTVLLTNFSSFHQNPFEMEPDLDPLLANNPFFTSGETWQTGRKRLTYAFSSMRLKILFQAVLGVTKKLDDFLKRRLENSDKYEVELKDLFSKFTGEVVANSGLGVEGFCFDDNPGPSSFQVIGQSFFEPSTTNGLIMSFVLFAPKLKKLLRMRWVPDKIDKFFRDITHDVLNRRRKESVSRNDFFQLMIDLEKTEGEKIDPDMLASHVFSFFVDGFETSSVTLSFVAYQLAKHPEIQEKLRQEVLTVLEKYDGELTYEGMKEMTYMDQVINESQRLVPALGNMTKMCTQEFELKGSDGLTCKMKPGMQLLIPNHALQTDPKYWKDPEIFDPDRFGDPRKKEIEKFTFLPFGEGPRACVGMRMAMTQMKAGLAAFLKDYTVELSPKMKLPLTLTPNHFLSAAEGGLWVYVRSR